VVILLSFGLVLGVAFTYYRVHYVIASVVIAFLGVLLSQYLAWNLPVSQTLFGYLMSVLPPSRALDLIWNMTHNMVNVGLAASHYSQWVLFIGVVVPLLGYGLGHALVSVFRPKKGK
jgi:hypothetical protein